MGLDWYVWWNPSCLVDRIWFRYPKRSDGQIRRTLLREAQTRDELEDVARMWEYSLMLRMLGPHQGIRLERLRAELDDRFEAQNQSLSSIEPEQHDQTQMVEQAMQVETKISSKYRFCAALTSVLAVSLMARDTNGILTIRGLHGIRNRRF